MGGASGGIRAVGWPYYVTLGARLFFRSFHIRTFPYIILFPHKHSPLVLALFQMADDGWIGGICFAEPGLPKLLILSLERIIGVT